MALVLEIEAMGVFDTRQSLQMGISSFSDDGHTQAPLQYYLELRSSDRLALGRDHLKEGIYPPFRSAQSGIAYATCGFGNFMTWWSNDFGGWVVQAVD